MGSMPHMQHQLPTLSITPGISSLSVNSPVLHDLIAVMVELRFLIDEVRVLNVQHHRGYANSIMDVEPFIGLVHVSHHTHAPKCFT